MKTNQVSEIVNEILERVMDGVRNAFFEEGKIIEEAKKLNGLPEDALIINKGDHSMIIDLIEDRALHSIEDTLEDLVDDGVIIINENRNSKTS